MVFQLILVGCVLGDVAWWRWADARVCRLPGRWLWRGIIALIAASEAGYVLAHLSSSLALSPPLHLPLPLAIAGYVWHLIILPPTIGLFALAATLRWSRRRRAGKPILETGERRPHSADEHRPTLPGARLTRRQVLGAAAAAAAPPVALAAVTGLAFQDLGQFRVRRAEIIVPSLPADLDGLTIAHVSDLHAGKFLRPGVAARVAAAVNDLAADLVVFTGDLIDIGDLGQLPAGVDFLRRLDPRHGLAIIEGNHDVMGNTDRFEEETREAGLPLLLDEATTFTVPGRPTPVQVLGLTWGDWKLGRDCGHYGRDADRRFRVWSDTAAAESVARVSALRQPGTFPLLLTHHPHAFDPAAEAGFPLVLAGHTHGGQLMLTDRIGVGPLRFRYWTGLYAKPASRLFVSNGIGNWFPLRLNAPTEVVHLTLRIDDKEG